MNLLLFALAFFVRMRAKRTPQLPTVRRRCHFGI
jgi:hypothetical protein